MAVNRRNKGTTGDGDGALKNHYSCWDQIRTGNCQSENTDV